ncbi:MAG: TilS substrate-binding domain-containing protein, partial [Polyangiales bacterium]
PPLRRSVLRAWVQTHTGHLLSARQLAQLSALSCRGQVLWVDAEWQVRWHEHALWLEPRPEP